MKTLQRQAETELGCVISVGYGMTENTCGTFLTPLGDVPEITTKTVGYPVPGCEGKIINPETEEILEEGQIGELCTRGYMVFQGYVGDPGSVMKNSQFQAFFVNNDEFPDFPNFYLTKIVTY